MAKPTKDAEREERIHLEAVVDAYDSGEQAAGWYCYLENKIHFPFLAKCTAKRAVSPLRVGDEVDVLGMAPEDECRHEMFVMVRREKDGLGNTDLSAFSRSLRSASSLAGSPTPGRSDPR